MIEPKDSTPSPSIISSVLKSINAESLSPPTPILKKPSSQEDNDVNNSTHIDETNHVDKKMYTSGSDENGIMAPKSPVIFVPNSDSASTGHSTDQSSMLTTSMTSMTSTATTTETETMGPVTTKEQFVCEQDLDVNLNINEKTTEKIGVHSHSHSHSHSALDTEMATTRIVANTDENDNDDDEHRDHTKNHRRNQSTTEVMTMKTSGSTGFSPPQTTTRRVGNNSAVVLTASSIASANITNNTHNEPIVRQTSSSDGTVSSLGDSTTATTTIIDNHESRGSHSPNHNHNETEHEQNNDNGHDHDNDNDNGHGIRIGNNEHHKLMIQKNISTDISIKTRNSSSKKSTCLSRRIPTRNRHQQKQQQQQQQQQQHNGGELTNNSTAVDNNTRCGEIKSNENPPIGPIKSETNCDVDTIMRFNDEITPNNTALVSSAANRRDRNEESTLQSLTSITAELDAAAKEQDKDRDQDQDPHRNQEGGAVNHRQNKDESNSRSSNDGDNGDNDSHHLYHKSQPPRAHNLQVEIDAVVNDVRCKQENIDCDDDDEEETDLGFDFVASPPRRSPIQGSRILHSNKTEINSNAPSDPTPPGNDIRCASRNSNTSDRESVKNSTKQSLKEEDGRVRTNADVVVEPASSSSPSKIDDRRNKLPLSPLLNKNRGNDSGSGESTCNEPRPLVGRTSRRPLYTNRDSYPEQQKLQRQRQSSPSQQLPHNSHQPHHAHHHIPHHHQSHYHNNHSNNNSTNNGQFQQPYHNPYRQPTSSSMPSPNGNRRLTQNKQYLPTMQHFPQHYGGGSNNTIAGGGGSGMYYPATSSSSNKQMHHLHQPHHLRQHHLHHHNNLAYPYLHNSNSMGGDVGGGMGWGQHPPSPDHHEAGPDTSNIRGRGSTGPSERAHHNQSSSPLKNAGSVDVTPNNMNKNDHVLQRSSRRGIGSNSGSDAKIIMGDFDDNDDGQDLLCSPPGKKKRKLMGGMIPTSWDEEHHHLQDNNRRVEEDSRHHDSNRRKAGGGSSQRDGEKLMDGEDSNRLNVVVGSGGNGMEKDELVMQSPAVFRPTRDPKRSPIFSSLTGTPTPYNYNGSSFAGVSFGMMDTPTPGRGIKLYDVFHGSRSFDNDANDANVPSIFPSFTDIETPNKGGGEAGDNASIVNDNQNPLVEGGGASPHMDFDRNMRNIPLVKSMSIGNHTPNRSGGSGNANGRYSHDQGLKLHESPFPLFRQELSPFHDRLSRSPTSVSPKKHRSRHNQQPSQTDRSIARQPSHRGRGEDPFSQQRSEFGGQVHHNHQHHHHPASPGPSPLPIRNRNDNASNFGITIPSLHSSRGVVTDDRRPPHRHERHPPRVPGVSVIFPNTSPTPRMQDQIVASTGPQHDNIRKGHQQKNPLFGGDDQAYPSSGGFRIKIGSGMEQTKTVMEQINDTIKGGQQPNHALGMNHHHPSRSPDGNTTRDTIGHILHHPHHNNNNHHHSANPLQTPIKVDGNPPSVVSTPSLTMIRGPGSNTRPDHRRSGGHSARRHSPTIPLATIPPGRFPSVVRSESSNPNMSSGGSRGNKKKDLIPVVGNSTTSMKNNKENESPTKPPRQRRNPCNCKKSKCLKLYCECFAAELYCDGCNCINCNNTKDHESVRSKAIKDTKTKNQHAFDTNVGCRCKKSACLKKYCECFEGGITCSAKCKCVQCQNYVGSQALIDRRRKIKDHKGADRVMRAADEFWKGNNPNVPMQIGPGVIRNPPPPPPPGMFPSPAGPHQHQHQHRHGHQMGGHHPGASHMRMHRHHPMMSPSMHGGPHHYMAPPHVMMGHPMGYSPVAMHPNPTPPFQSSGGMHRSVARTGGGAGSGGSTSNNSSSKRRHGTSQYRMPSLTTTPKTPASRRGFDPHSSKKKNRGEKEKANLYFGSRNPSQTKNSALAIFSFLSNDDIYNASLVSKAWSKMSLDEELWQFQEG